MSDKWLDWLARGRDAGEGEVRRRSLQMLLPIRDRVLASAQMRPGDAVLDIGTGEGLLGLAALDEVGRTGHVTFNDISSAAITCLQERLADQPVQTPTSMSTSPVQTLADVADASVDRVVARSVLIYVEDRVAAFRSLRRVLRPGGRLSLYEPVESVYPTVEQDPACFFGWYVPAVAQAAQRVTRAYLGTTALGSSQTLLSLGARELPDLAESVGFEHVSFSVEGTSTAAAIGDAHAVRAVVDGRPNPNAPSPREVADSVLSASEARRFVEELERAVRGGFGRQRHAAVYMSAF